MKKLLICIALLFLVICLPLTMFGCNHPGSAQSSDNSSMLNRESVTWLISCGGEMLEKSWFSYDVLSSVSLQLGIEPDIRVIKGNRSAEILKSLQSDHLPDQITVPVEDKMVLQLIHSGAIRKINDIPSLFQLIPKKVTDFHSQDGVLYYLPGGFYDETDSRSGLLPAEGIYINSGVLEKLGNPNIQSAADILYAIRSYRNLPDYHRGLPVIFGINGIGIQTLEHLYGILPEDKKKLDVNAELPVQFDPLLSFLGQLGQCGVDNQAFSIDEYVINEYLKNQALFYIGGADVISRYNLINPENPYFTVNPSKYDSGFLKALSPMGVYATFLCGGNDSSASAIRLAEYLLSEEGSNTAIMGLKNQHWLYDDYGNAVPFPDSQKRIFEGDSAYIRRTGIGVFPYLSSIGTAYPGRLAPSDILVKDILPEILDVRIDPTSEEGLKISQVEDMLMQAYITSLGLPPVDES